MKIVRILTVCLVSLLVSCEIIVGAANAESTYTESSALTTNGPIIIDDNADLEALGLNGSVSFANDNNTKDKKPSTKSLKNLHCPTKLLQL